MARKKTAIVGCGYLGSALGCALVSAGHDCVGTTTTESRAKTIEGFGGTAAIVRLAETKKLHKLLADRDTLFLTVAPNVAYSSYREVYLDGAQSLIRAVADTAVQHIVYTSSTSVYGQQDGGWVDELSPTIPETENGRLLLETENALLAHGESTKLIVTVLRLGGIYGPGRDPANRLAKSTIRERTDGDRYVNLIHRDDAISAMSVLLDRPYDGVLNLTDDRPTTRREYYDHLATDGILPIRWLPSEGLRRVGKRVRNDLVKRILDLRLKHPAHC